MSASDRIPKKARLEEQLRIHQQIAFASGLFQGDITIRTLLESLAEGVVIIDKSGTILLVNSYAEKMFGYPEKELIGQPHAVLIPERFKIIHQEHQAHFFSEPRIRPMGQLLDLVGRRKDGSEFPLEICLSYIETINGILVMAFISDITKRKQFESHLLESEQRFAVFMDHLPAAAWIKDLNGRYVYANPEAERIFSMPLSDLQGKTDEEIFPPETARLFRENDERVLLENGHLQTIEVMPQANHVEHHSMVSKFPVPGVDGHTAFVAGVAFDITELQRAKEEITRLNNELEHRVAERTSELRESEVRFRALVTASSNVIYRMSPDWSEMRQLRGQNFIADTEDPNRDWLRQYIHPDDQAHVVAAINEAIRTKSIFELEHRVLRVDGTLGWTFSRAIPLLDGNGEIVEWFGAASDVTERKKAEETLKKVNEELEKRVDERTAELEEANRELEAFNYTVAHDLRQPLNFLTIYCQAIDALCGDQLQGECAGYVQKTYKATLQMNSLIDAIFNFSHTGHAELRRETVDLSAIAREVVDGFEPTDSGRQFEIRITDGMVVKADAAMVRVVLENLLGNAWKYTGMRDKAVIEFGVTEMDGKPVYFVRDNGIGFNMMDAEKLFTPFHRLPGAEVFKGVGIGLATVGRIILRHAGRVWAESETDKGTTVYFTLSGDD